MNSKVKISVMYYLSIIICSIILILSIIEIKNLKINIENMPIGVLIPIVLIFFINMYIDTFIHELGHFISGKLMGFKLVKLIIFPYELRAIVAYKAFVDRDYEDALKYSEKIFKLVNLEEDSGLISFEKIQLEKILKEIHHLYME